MANTSCGTLDQFTNTPISTTNSPVVGVPTNSAAISSNVAPAASNVLGGFTTNGVAANNLTLEQGFSALSYGLGGLSANESYWDSLLYTAVQTAGSNDVTALHLLTNQGTNVSVGTLSNTVIATNTAGTIVAVSNLYGLLASQGSNQVVELTSATNTGTNIIGAITAESTNLYSGLTNMGFEYRCRDSCYGHERWRHEYACGNDWCDEFSDKLS